MNELSNLFLNIKSGDIVTLEKGKIYDVYQDEAFCHEGYFCSNTAKRHENSKGRKYSAIYLCEKSDITIDGNGATILIHGKMTPLLFDKCRNITVKNLTIDYACPTMTEFTILENNEGICIIKINDDCRYKIEKGHLIWMGEDDKNGKPYWESDYVGPGRYIKLFDPVTETAIDFSKKGLDFKDIKEIAPHTLRVTLRDKDIYFPEGHIIQTRSIVRDQTGSLFNRCKNLRFENLRVMFMHGLGMVSQFCENVSYINCDLTPKDGRTITSTADFFQFSGCKGNLAIENCKAWGAQDDYINVHGTHLRIIKKNERKKTITVRFMHPESWGFQAFEAGDELEFIKWDTLKPYAETKVVAYERLNDTDIRLTLDRPLPPLEKGRDVVENATWTPNLYVRNCDFGPTEGRGILATTRGEVIIENNRFRNLWGPALLIEDDCNFWFESGYTREIIFRNNTIINCEYASMWEGSPVIRYSPKVMDENSTHFVHGRLTLTGNTFSLPKEEKHRIYLESLREAHITNNIFDNPYEIVSKCVGSIYDENNIVKEA